MPGLTDNDRVTEALNQLIAATNEITTQLTALSGKIDSIDVSLPAMANWQVYLQYLKQIAEKAGCNAGTLQDDNVFSGDFGNPVTVTGKCRVSNSLFNHVYNCCNNAITQLATIADSNAGILIQIAKIFTFISPIDYGDYQNLLLAVGGGVINFTDLTTKLSSAKALIVPDIFAATTGTQVKDAFFDNLTLSTGQNLWLAALLLPDGVTSSVLDEDYWYSWDDPVSPVLCGDAPEVLLETSQSYPYNVMITGVVSSPGDANDPSYGWLLETLSPTALSWVGDNDHTGTVLVQVSFTVGNFVSNSYPVSCWIAKANSSGVYSNTPVVQINGAGDYSHEISLSNVGAYPIYFTMQRTGDSHQFTVSKVKVSYL